MVSRQISNKQESMERMKLLQTLNNKNNCFFFLREHQAFIISDLLSCFPFSQYRLCAFMFAKVTVSQYISPASFTVLLPSQIRERKEGFILTYLLRLIP